MHEEKVILQQPNVTVSSFGFNSIKVSWEAEEIVEKGHLNVCYNFSFGFSDKPLKKLQWIKMTNENDHKIKLHMHPQVVGSVSNGLCDSNLRIKFQSKPAKFIYTAPPVYITNVSCILFRITSLNCSWDFRTNAPQDTNYSFALRLNLKWVFCTHYLKRHKKNVGCYMEDVFWEYSDGGYPDKITIGFFSDSNNFSKTFQPEAVEILTPPRNIQVLSKNGDIIIQWYPPLSIAITRSEDEMTSTYDYGKERTFKYEIHVVENKSKHIFRRINNTLKNEQIFTDLTKDKQYYIQIRARHTHQSTKMWGEWSTPVFINKDKNVFPEWILIVIVPAFFATLAFYFCKRYMKKLLVTQIPYPSRNIKLFLHMNGSNDIGAQATIGTQIEQSVPLSDIEIVRTTGD
ncbi:interleukin-5 receptor subunit alpha-like isoform X2 [Engystomops pustulosus]|uniref:interleukin-5 receptor subunit alpha-like isoform X2 n=1 Tax=Engystomops pustulosus TaxID=76066 RepID=UPI003AFA6C2D